MGQQNERMPIAAVVLAGGRSSRMGRPKTLLPFDGVPLIVHVVSTLRNLFDEVVVVAAPDQELPPLSATIVRDEVPHLGPVGGLCYGLQAIGGEAAFVASCDSAFLNARVIGYLLDRFEGYEAVVPMWGGRPQPLHAVYARSVLPQLQSQLARGELRSVRLFETVQTRRVAEDELRSLDPEGWTFFNMNTPDDYTRALEHWREIHSGPASITEPSS